jgi:hypothetical protein
MIRGKRGARRFCCRHRRITCSCSARRLGSSLIFAGSIDGPVHRRRWQLICSGTPSAAVPSGTRTSYVHSSCNKTVDEAADRRSTPTRGTISTRAPTPESRTTRPPCLSFPLSHRTLGCLLPRRRRRLRCPTGSSRRTRERSCTITVVPINNRSLEQ